MITFLVMQLLISFLIWGSYVAERRRLGYFRKASLVMGLLLHVMATLGLLLLPQ